ncbi:hypothetical protein [Prosthecobacter sp.]|uniref:hypothetical protein n=1 Tax=Prosthecobacter sp. TaxID=1965333 RepID=UPI001D97EDBA|nr:hypothetical protein [Prosthecobacter sp.]MCB1276966.1 hypothetical protein [Prosthecobacter sp.]
MAFEFIPDSQQPVPEMEPPKERIGKFSIFLLSSFGLLLLILLSWGTLRDAAHAALARQNAKEAQEAIESKDWKRAYDALVLARTRAPEDVEVITTMVEFLKVTGADPGGLAQQIRLLEQKRVLTAEEELLLGRSLIASGKTKDAREIYEKLPVKESVEKPGMELLSSILHAEGHTKEAEEIATRAAAQGEDSPEVHLKSTLDDLQSPFGEVRNHAVRQLWQIAELSTEPALEAIGRLASSRSLTLPEAHRLLDLVQKHPLKTLPTRLQVTSALMRLQPDQRTNLADAEIQRFETDKNGKREEIAYWLMSEHLNDRVFSLIPKDLAIQSRELYPILVQALAQAERWEELKEVLKLPRPPVPKSLRDLAMAEVQSHLQPDMREARQLLQGTVVNAIQEGNVATLRTAAALAEKLDLADIAGLAYKEAGFRASALNAPEEAMQNLQKSAEMALRIKDTTTLLEVAGKLHELSPSSVVFSDRLTYLRLILGVEMETIDLSALTEHDAQKAGLSIKLERIPAELLLALSAYRLGDRTTMQKHLSSLQDAAALPPGPRAVAAGLLSMAGQTDRAYQIAEQIPGALLLDEERTFLKQAL